MTYFGRIKRGVVVLDGGVRLPEGTAVTVDFVPPSSDGDDEPEHPTLLERLMPVVGAAKGLPSDAAKHLDHYLYGRPRS